jgi:hypothetical protein
MQLFRDDAYLTRATESAPDRLLAATPVSYGVGRAILRGAESSQRGVEHLRHLLHAPEIFLQFFTQRGIFRGCAGFGLYLSACFSIQHGMFRLEIVADRAFIDAKDLPMGGLK